MRISADDVFYVVALKSGKKSGPFAISGLQHLVDSGKLSERSVLEDSTGHRLFAQDVTLLNFSVILDPDPKQMELDERLHKVHILLRWAMVLGLCVYTWPFAIAVTIWGIVQTELAKRAGLGRKSVSRVYWWIVVIFILSLVLGFMLFAILYAIVSAQSGPPQLNDSRNLQVGVK